LINSSGIVVCRHQRSFKVGLGLFRQHRLAGTADAVLTLLRLGRLRKTWIKGLGECDL
jgi:hypothetical protein